MSTSLTKLVTALCVVVLSVGTLYLGTSLAQESGGAGSGESPKSARSAKGQPDAPIDPKIALENPVQKELRLSENQVEKLQEAWNAGSDSTKAELKKRVAVEEEMKRLQERLEALRLEHGKLSKNINTTREQSLREAIHEHLSKPAVARLRQLSLRRLDMARLLEHPRIRAELNLDDEQLKKLHELRDWVVTPGTFLHGDKVTEVQPSGKLQPWIVRVPDGGTVLLSGAVWRLGDDRVLKILTPEQRRKWERMLGKPYPKEK